MTFVDNQLLWWAYNKFANKPQFMAYTFGVYCEVTKLTLPELAKYLNCSLNDICNIGLCTNPNKETLTNFNLDIKIISNRFGVSFTKLRLICLLGINPNFE